MWNLTSSCTLMAGTTSHGTTQPSITFWPGFPAPADRHADGGGAQRLQRLAGEPRREAQLEALQVVLRLDLLIGVDQAVVVRPEGQELHVLGLAGKVGRRELGARPRVDQRAARGGERQLEGLRGGEAARRVAGQRPDDVDDAVLGLVVELGRRAAELHGGKDVDLQSTLRVGLHLPRPGVRNF